MPIMSPKVKHALAKSRNAWVRFLALLGSALILLSCATRTQNPFDASGGGKAGDSGVRHRVRFEVVCRECQIAWRVGMDGETLTDRGSGSHSVTAFPQMGDTYASLSASPTPGAGPVSWVRIRVDGKVVAEAKNDEATGVIDSNSRRSLYIETTIPAG